MSSSSTSTGEKMKEVEKDRDAPYRHIFEHSAFQELVGRIHYLESHFEEQSRLVEEYRDQLDKLRVAHSDSQSYFANQLEGFRNGYQEQNTALAQLNEAYLASRTTTNMATPSRAEPKIADPDFYTGDRLQLQNFLSKCRLKFAAQSSRFDTEEKKIFYAGSFLKDAPYSWFQPLLAQAEAATHPIEGQPVVTPPPEFASFAFFAAALTTMYGDPNIEATSERVLNQLRQTGSVAKYIAEFQRLRQYIKWNESALANRFYEGLKDNIKDQIANQGKPESLAALQAFATRLDARLFERYLEKRPSPLPNYNPSAGRAGPPNTTTVPALNNSAPRPFVPFNGVTRGPSTPLPPKPQFTNRPIVAHSDGTTPMQLDTVSKSWKLSAEEKARRRQLNLCDYCGQPGHNIFNCTKRPPRRDPSYYAQAMAASLETSYDSETTYPLSEKDNVHTEEKVTSEE
jgi:Retrotransposon gag protein